ncbi:CPBP family intramembrane glutamic endopeptidase [Pseudarthrobacter sp. L1SW]|uniref:CPBP family intramembrane glutamic endopeptidase n=1 Tax=Pseudarthrobacter sp. L1SW TaxID=2851598 RepID=UPI001E65CBDB|nr:type II CAAX endopeptidase family protein [Pseudarthrobacter sp. L1SW]UEL29507.1 CPBP family intramembrane metalloprotease [Pseudarthrobacter sp. L1SW]
MTTHSHRPRGWAARHDVLLYLVLAYVIAWSIWPLVLLNPVSSPLVPFGPGLAAVLVAVTAGGRRELFGLLRQLGRWRVHPGWYGVALGVPLAVAGIAFGAAVMAGAPVPRWEPSDLLQVAGSIAVTVVIVGIFEELGWRGFLLPRLQRGRSALAAAVLVGLVWLPWHLPEFVSDPGQRPLAPFAIYILGQSVVLAWLYNSSHASLPMVILFHAALNSYARFFLSELQGGGPYLVAWYALAGVTAVLALAVTAYAGSRNLARSELKPVH